MKQLLHLGNVLNTMQQQQQDEELEFQATALQE
jgi:hypothetical protein